MLPAHHPYLPSHSQNSMQQPGQLKSGESTTFQIMQQLGTIENTGARHPLCYSASISNFTDAQHLNITRHLNFTRHLKISQHLIPARHLILTRHLIFTRLLKKFSRLALTCSAPSNEFSQALQTFILQLFFLSVANFFNFK